jgi:hypothetical protein
MTTGCEQYNDVTDVLFSRHAFGVRGPDVWQLRSNACMTPGSPTPLAWRLNGILKRLM